MRLTRALPGALSGAIEAEFTRPPDRNLAYKIADYLQAKYMYQDFAASEFIPVSVKHWRDRIGTHYLPTLQRMERAGIIDADHYYLPGQLTSAPGRGKSPKGICKRYRFSPALIAGDPVTVEIEHRRQKRAPFATDYITQTTVDLLGRVKLTLKTEKEIRRHVDQVVTAEYITDPKRYRTGDDIPDGVYQAIKDGRKMRKHITLAQLRAIAGREGKQVILYRGRCYIDDPAEFIRQRIADTRAAHVGALLKIKDSHIRANIRCKRNDTNNRLDTTITNLPSVYIPLLRMDGEELVSIDLKNSQFTLLAHVIGDIMQYINELDSKYFKENTLKLFSYVAAHAYGDIITERKVRKVRERMTNTQVERIIYHIVTNTFTTDCKSEQLRAFQELTKSGTFYEYFGDILSVEGYPLGKNVRETAKGIMFLVAFAKHRHSSPAKKILSKYFPALVELMDGFKKGMVEHYRGEGDPEAVDKGNAELAVMLQQVESSIFIDDILTRLLRAGYRVFTKHDSILCKRSDLADVLAIVRDELDAILGPGGYRLDVPKVEEGKAKERQSEMNGKTLLVDNRPQAETGKAHDFPQWPDLPKSRGQNVPLKNDPFSGPTSDDLGGLTYEHTTKGLKTRPARHNLSNFESYESTDTTEQAQNVQGAGSQVLRRGFFQLDDG